MHATRTHLSAELLAQLAGAVALLRALTALVPSAVGPRAVAPAAAAGAVELEVDGDLRAAVRVAQLALGARVEARLVGAGAEAAARGDAHLDGRSCVE